MYTFQNAEKKYFGKNEKINEKIRYFCHAALIQSETVQIW